MLEIIYGSSDRIVRGLLMEELHQTVKQEKTGLLLLVPDQYSHTMERTLCEICGDTVSLYAEVLSFPRLANRVFSQEGGLARSRLENGGRILMMARAFEVAESQLHFFSAKKQRPEFLMELVEAYDEARCYMVSPEQLRIAAEVADPFIRDKLMDLALIFESYDAFCSQIKEDPRELLTQLTEAIQNGHFMEDKTVYICGFDGFTPQEQELLYQTMKKAQNIFAFFVCDQLEEPAQDCFARCRKTIRSLLRYAHRYGVSDKIREMSLNEKSSRNILNYFEKTLFDYQAKPFLENTDALQICIAESPLDECELVASEIRRLVQEEGYRYKDIAVTARDFSLYESHVRGVMEKYGVPLYQDETVSLLDKPVLSVVLCALSVVEYGYDYELLFRYLKTGLTSLSLDEIDRLEEYVLLWNIRGDQWRREWTMSPRGLGDRIGETGKDTEQLHWLNEKRRQVYSPLEKLRENSSGNKTVRQFAQSLFEFLEEIGVPEKIQIRERDLRERDALQQADEYRQLWEILVQALDQCVLILDDMEMDLAKFSGLFRLALSQYKIGTIPVALDRVSVGVAERMRSRNIRVLFLMGATEDSLPLLKEKTGIFSDADREFLFDQGLSLGIWGTQRMEQELGIIYSMISLPQDKLILSYPIMREEEMTPSFVVTRARTLLPGCRFFSQREMAGDQYLWAARPCFEFAVTSAVNELATKKSRCLAQAVFQNDPLFQHLLHQKPLARGPLSAENVRRLFGTRIKMSASRMDRYRTCRFSYFLQYGLKLKPRRQARFDAPAIGTFLHYILENTVREIQKTGQLSSVTEEQITMITNQLIHRYVQQELGGLEDKSARFRHLFYRLCETVSRLVENVLKELRNGDFVPLDYELRFSKDGDMPPIEFQLGKTAMEISGVVDRVDGFISGDKLYLRIMDYKTGLKTFNLTDIWHGLNIQMLLYLFALEIMGEKRYGKEIVPSGVLYVPLRDFIIRQNRHCSKEALEQECRTLLRRSGLVLRDDAVLEAMEHGVTDKAEFLPITRTKKGTLDARSSLATMEQFGLLQKHIQKLLYELADEITSGRVDAEPFYRSQAETACDFCEFALACQFDVSNQCDHMRYLYRVKEDDFWRLVGGDSNGN